MTFDICGGKVYTILDPSCRKSCDLIGQEQVSISRINLQKNSYKPVKFPYKLVKKLLPMVRIVARQQFIS